VTRPPPILGTATGWGWIASAGRPLRASSQAITELEFHAQQLCAGHRLVYRETPPTMVACVTALDDRLSHALED
jgi:hypothetical protein